LLSIELAQAGNYRVAEWASCECGICLNQRHLDLRIETLELPGAGGSGEASANDDDASSTLRYRAAAEPINSRRLTCLPPMTLIPIFYRCA
jgi:hypothetical protein